MGKLKRTIRYNKKNGKRGLLYGKLVSEIISRKLEVNLQEPVMIADTVVPFEPKTVTQTRFRLNKTTWEWYHREELPMEEELKVEAGQQQQLGEEEEEEEEDENEDEFMVLDTEDDHEEEVEAEKEEEELAAENGDEKMEDAEEERELQDLMETVDERSL